MIRLIQVAVPPWTDAIQVEFPEHVERSRSGAWHVRPGLVDELTSAEIEFIRKEFPELAASLQIRPEPVVKIQVPAEPVPVHIRLEVADSKSDQESSSREPVPAPRTALESVRIEKADDSPLAPEIALKPLPVTKDAVSNKARKKPKR